MPSWPRWGLQHMESMWIPEHAASRGVIPTFVQKSNCQVLRTSCHAIACIALLCMVYCANLPDSNTILSGTNMYDMTCKVGNFSVECSRRRPAQCYESNICRPILVLYPFTDPAIISFTSPQRSTLSLPLLTCFEWCHSTRSKSARLDKAAFKLVMKSKLSMEQHYNSRNCHL